MDLNSGQVSCDCFNDYSTTLSSAVLETTSPRETTRTCVVCTRHATGLHTYVLSRHTNIPSLTKRCKMAKHL